MLIVCRHAVRLHNLSHRFLAQDHDDTRPPQDRDDTRQPQVLNFQDTKSAYASKTTAELIRARLVLKLCSLDFIVNNNDQLMKFGRAVLRGGIFERLMKMTFYGHFVGGVDVQDLKHKLDKMQEYGVKPILDYSVEADLNEDSADESPEPVLRTEDVKYKPDHISSHRGLYKTLARSYPYHGEKSCEANLKIFVECLETATAVCDGAAFSAIKVTGLSKPNALLESARLLSRIKELYEEYSEPYHDSLPSYISLYALPKDVLGPKILLAQRRMTPEHFTKMLKAFKCKLSPDEVNAIFVENANNAGLLEFHTFRSMCIPNNLLYDMFIKLKTKDGFVLDELSPENVDAMKRLEDRLALLAERAVELDAKLLIDAEQTYFQPVIDYYANWLMAKYNTNDAHIFNTYQCYLKGTPSQLISDTQKAYRLGYKIGIKLVRGAYMEQERQRAEDLGYEDPIYPNKALTNSCYLNMAEMVLPLVRERKCEVMMATHNEFTIQYVVERMRQSDIHPRDGGIYFGQLLGMCDQVTYLLGAGGYCSYKYVPYGPVDAVLPYLSRRAHENKGMMQGSQKELDLLKSELRRRKYGLM